MNTQYAVMFLSGRGMRDRIVHEDFGQHRGAIYWSEAARPNNGDSVDNPAQVFMVETQEAQDVLVNILTRKWPGCTCMKVTVNEVISSVIPETIKLKRAKWSEKGLLPA
jgi:hypothetical protein